MTDHTISISDRLYAKAQRLAELTSQTVEAIIRSRLEDALSETAVEMAIDERDELRAMRYLSDDALFSMMQEQMQRTKQERMSRLMEKNSDGTISADEYVELNALVDAGQRLTLRKSTALGLLLDRGYQLSLDDMKAEDA